MSFFQFLVKSQITSQPLKDLRVVSETEPLPGNAEPKRTGFFKIFTKPPKSSPKLKPLLLSSKATVKRAPGRLTAAVQTVKKAFTDEGMKSTPSKGLRKLVLATKRVVNPRCERPRPEQIIIEVYHSPAVLSVHQDIERLSLDGVRLQEKYIYEAANKKDSSLVLAASVPHVLPTLADKSPTTTSPSLPPSPFAEDRDLFYDADSPKPGSDTSSVTTVDSFEFCVLSTKVDTPALQHLRLVRTVGQGCFGAVWQAMQRDTNKTVALKVMSKERKGDAPMEAFRRIQGAIDEQCALKRCIGIPGIVQLFRSCHDSENFYLEMEYCPGGSLQALLDEKWALSPSLAKFYAAQLFTTLLTLHDQGIVHRDVKPANIMLDTAGHLHLVDLGLAEVQAVPQPVSAIPVWLRMHYPVCVANPPPLIQGTLGSLPYMAPEMFSEAGYTAAVDFWALAVVLYEMTHGAVPWLHLDVDRFRDMILHDEPVLQEDLEDSLKQLLTEMLRKDPKERLSVEDIMNSRYFFEIDWEKMAKRELAVPSDLADIQLEERCDYIDSIPIVGGQPYTEDEDPFPAFTYAQQRSQCT